MHGLTAPLLLAALSLTATSSGQAGTPAQCAGRVSLPGLKAAPGTSVFLLDDTLLFATGKIVLDIDGHPRAYGVKDQGIEDICNGLGPLEPPACRGKVRDVCYKHCQAAFRKWNGHPADLGSVMCSIGLGGGGCDPPQARLQSPPKQDWFVSETSVHPAPPPNVPLSDWITRQEGQLDSEEIPYFVIPSTFRAKPWDATPGDVGVVVGASGTAYPFIVGDTGGHLDEGSAKLLAQIRGLDRLPTIQKTNAFGKSVDRLQGALAGDYRVAIFRHTAKRIGDKGTVLSVAAADIPEVIATVGRDRLKAIGGGARIRACSK